MEALLDCLERQLQSGTVSLPAACQRLSAQLRQATTDDIKSLHLCLPKLLSHLMYSSGTNIKSWPSKCVMQSDYDALNGLLAPDGPLFSVLLAHSHKAIYDIPDSQLPLNVAKVLTEMKNPAALSPAFKDRMVLAHSGGHVLRLDMVEYFLFFLVYTVFLPKEMGSQTASPGWFSSVLERVSSSVSRQVPVNDLLILQSPGTLQTQFDNHTRAELHFVLLDQYFKFLLPMANSKTSNLFTSRLALHQTFCIRLSEFFLSICTEYYLQQSSYDVDERTKRPVSKLSVNLDQVLATQRLVEHMTTATFTPALNYAVQGLIEGVLPVYRVLLYRQLRLFLFSWPLDNTLVEWMELWMTAIFPWRVMADIEVDLKQLLLHDYHIYHTLFDDVLEVYYSVFDSWSQLDHDSVDGQALLLQAGPLTAGLLDALLNMERLLPGLKSFEAELTQSFNKSSVAHVIGDQQHAREPAGKFTPPILFGDSARQRAAFLAGLLEQISDSLLSLGSQAEITCGWINELIAKLKTFFDFKEPAFMPMNRIQSEAPDHTAGSRMRYVLNDPANKLIALKNIRSAASVIYKKGEVKILVQLFNVLSQQLDSALHRHLDTTLIGPLCKNLHINLRFLAVPGNLLLAFVSATLLFYLMIRSLRSFFH